MHPIQKFFWYNGGSTTTTYSIFVPNQWGTFETLCLERIVQVVETLVAFPEKKEWKRSRFSRWRKFNFFFCFRKHLSKVMVILSMRIYMVRVSVVIVFKWCSGAHVGPLRMNGSLSKCWCCYRSSRNVRFLFLIRVLYIPRKGVHITLFFRSPLSLVRFTRYFRNS